MIITVTLITCTHYCAIMRLCVHSCTLAHRYQRDQRPAGEGASLPGLGASRWRWRGRIATRSGSLSLALARAHRCPGLGASRWRWRGRIAVQVWESLAGAGAGASLSRSGSLSLALALAHRCPGLGASRWRWRASYVRYRLIFAVGWLPL